MKYLTETVKYLTGAVKYVTNRARAANSSAQRQRVWRKGGPSQQAETMFTNSGRHLVPLHPPGLLLLLLQLLLLLLLLRLSGHFSQPTGFQKLT